MITNGSDSFFLEKRGIFANARVSLFSSGPEPTEAELKEYDDARIRMGSTWS